MLKNTALLIGFLCLLTISTQAQRYPYVLGFVAGEQVEFGDSNKVSFSGGSPFPTSWQNLLISGADSNNLLSGFRYDALFVDQGFNEELFASKGYFGDYVELRWDLARYASQVTGFRIYRKEVGSTEDSVQVANLPASTRTWQDQYAESGTMYHYTLWAEGIFPVTRKLLNLIEGVGFRIPYGRISGRVTYAGGTAVQGVSIIAETQDNFSGSGFYLNGADAYLEISTELDDPKFKFDTAFTFQMWYRPENTTGTGTIFEKENQYKITHSTGSVTFAAGSESVSLNFIERPDTFFNITVTRSSDSLILYIIYNQNNYAKAAQALTVSTPVNNNVVSIGRSVSGEYLKGNIDEIRIWHRSFNEDEIIPMTVRYIEGTENYLTAYYRLNEGVGGHFYDLSRKGFNFNEHHGYKSPAVVWDSSRIPFKNQLAVKGVTDVSGNFIISGIPYATNGSIYKFVPIFGVHSFNPTDQLLFLGPGAGIHNNINFTDVASFTVTGEVYYKDTYFPVEGVSVRVDGQLALKSSGIPITTDATGKFVVDVPIGQHFIQVEKSGHYFRNAGRFPAVEDTYFDFQQPYTLQQPLIDTTLVKVIGKVVGGPLQEAKPKGMGKTVNNLGQGKIVMTTQKGYDLTDKSGGVNITTTNESFEGTLTKDNGDTKVNIIATAPKQIEIEPDPVTGEYVAWLLPEKYVITAITAGNYTYPASFHSTVDLLNVLPFTTEIDSVLTGTVLSPLGDTLNTYRIDSVGYQRNLDFIYRVTPDISVTNKEDEKTFWEKEVTTKDDSLISVVDSSGAPLTQWPIFIQRRSYDLKISIFESYTNNLTSVTDKVPVKDGVVEIQNALSTVVSKQAFQIDDFGEVNYSFTAGLPNIVGDYTNSMSITALTGKGGAIQTQWNYSNGTYLGPFKGYVFGGLPTGNNFVTAGPNKVDMILRDPYGSQSYAWFDKDHTVNKTTRYNVVNTQKGSGKLTFHLGGSVKTFTGVGAGVITEVEVKHDLAIGLEHSETWLNDSTTVTTTTASQQWKTSNDPLFVGANGDVFIGHSTNIVYGISQMLDLIDSTDCLNCQQQHGTGKYEIGIHEALRVNPEFNTAFQFSQDHIKNFLIPNLVRIRNIYLQNSPYHTSHHPLGSAEYAARNDSMTTTMVVSGTDTIITFAGQHYSYVLNIPTDWPLTDSLFVDSVAYYNEQIKNWEQILANNEKDKVLAVQLKNISFDAGVVYNQSSSYASSTNILSSFEWMISPSIAGKTGGVLNKFGVTAELTESYAHTNTEADGTETVNSTTFGYELADSDFGDYLSIDVKQPPSATGPVFAIRGGQTQCPYNNAEVTKYFQPGTIISEASAQREVPQITCTAPVQINVPEDQAALFQVQLGNVSQTKDDVWFMVSVDEASNQNGALISMDGAAIGNGKVILISSGTAINKIISIKKTLPAVNDYQDIGIVLRSICQSDPTDTWKDIADTIFLTARFKPVCSKVDISSPLNQWVRNTNTGTNLSVLLDDYNLGHSTFKEIAFQYKSTSSSAWITEQKFFVDYADFQADSTAGNSGIWINNSPNLTYVWDMSSVQDRTYDIRAQTTCTDLTTHTSAVLTGIKDTKRPKIFGTPQPGDGILSPGEDVMLSFDETIEAGLLLSSNFSVRGVLNGATLRHSSSLYFDGVDDYASALAGVNLSGKSFSIEFWTKREDLNAGAIFHQNQIETGFNSSGNFYVTMGTQTSTTVESYSFTDKWIHFTITYDAASRNVNIYSAYQGHNDIEIQDQSFPNAFAADGRMYVGNNAAKSNAYHGLIHDLRVWEKVIGYGTANAQMLVSLSGDEIGLSGLWPMNEKKGAFATDVVRSHHAILHGATWRVSPSGYARNFNGASNLSIPAASSVVITDEMDFTIEFWFKGGPQSNTILFSNGIGDGSESPAAFPNIWNIGFDASGRLYAQNNAVSITDIDSDFLDNKWHHFALVLKRKGNASIYVDGNLETSSHSSNFGGLVANSLVLGSNRHYTNGTPYSKQYTGSMDEFRIWKLARTAKLLSMDMHNKIQGDEQGLVAYYPFDKYDVNLVLQPILNDCDVNENTDSLTGNIATENGPGGTFNSANVPKIADARPVQNLALNWVVNNDKIIINIDEPAALIEKCVIEFTVDRVEDMRENRMASPETWTAFIRQNTVLWDQESFAFVKPQYDSLSFQVDVNNIGGVPENYTITNLPSWLTVSSANGTVAPAGNQTITFIVDPAVNIGTYEEVIYLTSDLGFSESLLIKLKVAGDQPNWTVNPTKFQYSMNVIGRIRVDSIVSTDPDDKLIALVNDSVRGIAKLVYYPAYDAYLVFMDIYSNQVGGENIEFYVWDASKGKTHTEVNPSLIFQQNMLHGSPNAPLVFDAINNFYEPIAVAKGWNWISFPLHSADHSDLNKLLFSIPSQDGDVIKGLTKYDQYSSSVGWLGTITSGGGIRNEEMYKLHASFADTIDYIGSKVDPFLTPIPIDSGWNWIGFISQNNMSIANAFGNYQVAHDDLIKGQLSFAIYDSLLGWVGNLGYLKPKAGYMFKSSKADTLIYPDSDLFRNKNAPLDKQEKLNAELAMNEHKYKYNMSLIAQAELCENAENGSYILMAQHDEEIRGASLSDGQMFYITIYGDKPAEEIDLVLINEYGSRFEITEKMEFSPDKISGRPQTPVLLSSPDSSLYSCEETVTDKNPLLWIYPSPFHHFLQIDYVMAESGTVTIELYDASGRLIYTLLNAGKSEGPHSLEWSDHKLPAGVYVIKARLGNQPEPIIRKVIKAIK